MTRSFVTHDLNSAPVAARPILEENRKKFGKIPSPLARYAASPVTLQAALAGLKAFEQSSLPPLEREVLAMVMARKNGCDYCVRLHRPLLGMLDAPPGLSPIGASMAAKPSRRFVSAAARGTLRGFHRGAARAHGRRWTQRQPGKAFLDAGFDRAAALGGRYWASLAYTLYDLRQSPDRSWARSTRRSHDSLRARGSFLLRGRARCRFAARAGRGGPNGDFDLLVAERAHQALYCAPRVVARLAAEQGPACSAASSTSACARLPGEPASRGFPGAWRARQCAACARTFSNCRARRETLRVQAG